MTGAKPAVTVAVHDGFYGCGTGAGASNHDFLRVLCGLLGQGVQLTVMPIELAADSPDYDADWHASSIELVARAGGQVVPVGNGTAGATRFGGLVNFHQASASAARTIMAAFDQAPRSLAVAFDAPFFGLAPLLPGKHARNTVIVARDRRAARTRRPRPYRVGASRPARARRIRRAGRRDIPAHPGTPRRRLRHPGRIGGRPDQRPDSRRDAALVRARRMRAPVSRGRPRVPARLRAGRTVQGVR